MLALPPHRVTSVACLALLGVAGSAGIGFVTRPADARADGSVSAAATGTAASFDRPLTAADLQAALQTVGLDATPDELQLMLRGVRAHRTTFERIRQRPLDNAVEPSLTFEPLGDPTRWSDAPWHDLQLPDVQRPDDIEQLAFAEIPELASLIRTRQVSCVELTELFLARSERLDPTLHAVITLMPERARRRAAELDAMLDEGIWLGPLHGIPYGAKDLLAAKGAPTTWGATPYRDQVLDHDAAVITRLHERGAVLLAKLSLGALAWGDVWFGGKTRNPWQPQQGSSGSSAGPAAATAAAMVPFAIGSETLGSIVSPSVRCGTTGLRPTFGLVSRDGAMALSWSMDKLGPICRSAADAALVLDALVGSTEVTDATAGQGRQRSFTPTDTPPPARVGVLAGAFRDGDPFLAELEQTGCELVPFELPESAAAARDLTFVLDCEAAAAFDELTRSGRDDELVRQVDRAWPNVFRVARLIPAVEYLQAQRLRRLAMRDLIAAFDAAEIDVFVHPPYAGPVLSLTNLTGNPTLVAPRGLREDGQPDAVAFTGRTYADAEVARLAQAWQRRFPHHSAARPSVR